MVTAARVTGAVGNTLDEPSQAVALVARGRVETVAEQGELVGRVVLVP